MQDSKVSILNFASVPQKLFSDIDWFALRPRRAHPFALVRKDAKHAQRGKTITAQHECLMFSPSAYPQESPRSYFVSVRAGSFSLYVLISGLNVSNVKQCDS